MDVPDETDCLSPTDRNRIDSPKTKSSKLCFDKGYLKAKDKDLFIEGYKWKSSVDICSPLRKDSTEFGNLMKVINQESSRKVVPQRSAFQRKRIKSFNNEFKLLPLLRKVSWDPATSNASQYNNACGGRMHIEEFKEAVNLTPMFKDDENSISDDVWDEPFIVTVNDISPAKARRS